MKPKRYIQKIAVLCLGLLSAACAFYGEEYNLTPVLQNDWKTARVPSGVGNPYQQYYFDCDEYFVHLREILVSHKMHSAGPIVPVFPTGEERNYGEENLEFWIFIEGDIGAIEDELKALKTTVSLGGQVYEPSAQEPKFSRYDIKDRQVRAGKKAYSSTGYYSNKLTFPIALRNASGFELRIDASETGCKIGPLTFALKGGKYYRPHIMPGI